MKKPHNKRDREILDLRLARKTYKEIGEIYGISACRVQQVIHSWRKVANWWTKNRENW